MQVIIGMPSHTFEGHDKNKVIVYEKYREYEYNLIYDILDGDNCICNETP